MENEFKIVRNIILYFFITIIVLSIGGFYISKLGEATHINDAVQTYEDFQEVYNTCIKLNTDLCNMHSLDEKDVMFEQFSKAQRINTIKTQLNKWCENYNAKSKMWGRNLWKSKDLPYEIKPQDFSCYK